MNTLAPCGVVRATLVRPSPNSMVLGDDDPTARPDNGEPIDVFSILGEFVVVVLHLAAGLSQRPGHDVPPDAAIDPED